MSVCLLSTLTCALKRGMTIQYGQVRMVEEAVRHWSGRWSSFVIGGFTGEVFSSTLESTALT